MNLQFWYLACSKVILNKMTEKRFLVYTTINGNVNAHIEHGEHTTGEGRSKANPNELKRFELSSYDSEDLKILKIKYPFLMGGS